MVLALSFDELVKALDSRKESIIIKGRIVEKTQNSIEIEGEFGGVRERFRFEQKGNEVWLIRVIGGKNMTVRRLSGPLPHVEASKDSVVILPNYLMSYESLTNNDNNDIKIRQNYPSYPTEQPGVARTDPRYKPDTDNYNDDEEEEKRL